MKSRQGPVSCVRLTVPDSLLGSVSQIVHGADIDRQGNALFAIGDERATHLVFGSRAVVQMPDAISSPRLRVLSPDVALIAYPRVHSEKEKNAWIIRSDNKIECDFAIGDGVEDILATENFVVVTYFDEGVSGDIAPSWHGLAVFDRSGRFLWGWDGTIAPDKASRILDCYAALWLGGDHVAVVYHTLSGDSEELAILDLESRSVVIHQVPEVLNGSRALSIMNDIWLFRAPFHAKQSVFAWHPDSRPIEVARLPEPSRDRWPCRGLKGGSFLDRLRSHAELITIEEKTVAGES